MKTIQALLSSALLIATAIVANADDWLFEDFTVSIGGSPERPYIDTNGSPVDQTYTAFPEFRQLDGPLKDEAMQKPRVGYKWEVPVDMGGRIKDANDQESVVLRFLAGDPPDTDLAVVCTLLDPNTGLAILKADGTPYKAEATFHICVPSWDVGDEIQCSGGIVAPVSSCSPSAELELSVSPVDIDVRTPPGMADPNDTCLVTWQAAAGAFKNGNQGNTVIWVAPATRQAGIEITATITDLGEKLDTESGSRDDTGDCVVSTKINTLNTRIEIEQFARIPSGVPRSVRITVDPPLPDGEFLTLTCVADPGTTGQVLLSDAQVTQTTDVRLLSTAGVQSWGADGPAAGNMKLSALFNGGLAAQRAFTICSHPTDFHYIGSIGARPAGYYGFSALMDCSSDGLGGGRSWLDKCVLEERLSGLVFGAPFHDVVLPGEKTWRLTWADLVDTFGVRKDLLYSYQAGACTHSQTMSFRCERCGATGVLSLNTVRHQVYDAAEEGQPPVWRMRHTLEHSAPPSSSASSSESMGEDPGPPGE